MASSRKGADFVREAILANASLFGIAAAFSAAISVLALTVSLYMLQVYDRVLTSRSEETLFLLTVIALGSLATLGVLDSLRIRLLMRAGMRVAESLSGDVLRAMIGASALAGGAAARQGLRDIDTLRNFIGSPALAALFDAPFLIVFLAVLALLHWAFLLVVLLGGAILVGIALVNQAVNSGTLNRSIGLLAHAHAFAEDGLQNADVLEGMGMSTAFAGRWRRLWLESVRLGLTASDRDSCFVAASKSVRQSIQVALLGTGALLVLQFHATGGVMIAASILGGRALAPIEAGIGAWKSIVAVRLARERLRALLDEVPKREEGMPLPAPKGELKLLGASYAHPATRRRILAGISLDLRAGDALGVIGPSASGKSTLMRLIAGAWPCTSGSIRLDGADIYTWPRANLSWYIGYLPQDIELFSGTVRENIARLAAGDPDLVVAAARFANAHEMILALPKGYDTEIGGQGHRLSGGQRQRIALARALYGEPRLVVLDEPNSNLDALGDEALMATLDELKRRAITTIVVAHRPSFLDRMDKLLVLRDGAMEAFGSRNEIMPRYTARPSRPAPQQNIVPLATGALQAGSEDFGVQRGKR